MLPDPSEHAAIFSKHLPAADPETAAYAARAVELSGQQLVTRATEWVAREFELLADWVNTIDMNELPEETATVERMKAMLRREFSHRSAFYQAMADRDRIMRGEPPYKQPG